MKKRSLIPIFMAGLMTVQSVFPVFASDLTASDVTVTGDGRQTEQALVTYKDEILKINCIVSIPKKIYLDKATKSQDYQITAKGNLNQETSLKVRPVDKIEDSSEVDFYMKRQDKTVADVVATVEQAETEWTNEEVTAEGKSKPGKVSVPDITPGHWEGDLQFGIGLYDTITGQLKTDGLGGSGHEHVYGENGRCECGELDPAHVHDYTNNGICKCGDVSEADHTHIYDDAGNCACGAVHTEHTYGDNDLCTECGKLNPDHVHSYDEHGNCICGNATVTDATWAYTLDDEANTITLTQYKGNATEVTVHGSYEIDGKTYQTKIGNNTTYSGKPDGVPKVTDYMFAQNESVTSIIFEPSVDTSDVTNMASMFYNCSKLKTLDISCFDTSSATTMEGMFAHCKSLTSLDLSNFDTSNVISMKDMFSCNDGQLTTLNLSSFNTGNVTNMESMFTGQSSLTHLDVSSFDTSNVVYMSNMFAMMSSLVELDIRNFDTHKVTYMDNMFKECNSLTAIYVSNTKWKLANIYNNLMLPNGLELTKVDP